MNIILPDDIERLCDEINKRGYSTYIIGSSLRDAMSQGKVKKWDIITSATPAELHDIFNNSSIFGILDMRETEKYGVSVIRSCGKNIELSTMRQDGLYNRYSKTALYTRDIMEDLSHRDFTINAIAYDTKNHKVIDFKNGNRDFVKGILRCVSDSNECIKDDPVRIFRAYRFMHTYRMRMDENLRGAITNNVDLIDKIPMNRAYEEFNKIILAPNPGSILHDLSKLDALRNVLPEYNMLLDYDQNNRYQIYNLEEHSIRVMNKVSPKVELRLAALLHDLGKPVVGFVDRDGEKNYIAHAAAGAAFAELAMNRLGYDQHISSTVCDLIKYHEVVPTTERQLKGFVSEHGVDFTKALFELRKADILCGSRYSIQMNLPNITSMMKILDKMPDGEKTFPVSMLPINGNDIKQYMGVKNPTKVQGLFIGDTLRRCASEALIRPECNTKEFMEAFAKSIVGNNKIPDFVPDEVDEPIDDFSMLRTCDI